MLGYFNIVDLEIVIQEMRKEYDEIHLLGYSVGANLIQNYLTELWNLKNAEEDLKANPNSSSPPALNPLYCKEISDLSLSCVIKSAVCISPIYHFKTTADIISSKPWINVVLNTKFMNYMKANIQYPDFKAAMESVDIKRAELEKQLTFTDLNGFILKKVFAEEDQSKAFEMASPVFDLKHVKTPILCISSLDDIIVE